MAGLRAHRLRRPSSGPRCESRSWRRAGRDHDLREVRDPHSRCAGIRRLRRCRGRACPQAVADGAVAGPEIVAPSVRERNSASPDVVLPLLPEAQLPGRTAAPPRECSSGMHDRAGRPQLVQLERLVRAQRRAHVLGGAAARGLLAGAARCKDQTAPGCRSVAEPVAMPIARSSQVGRTATVRCIRRSQSARSRHPVRDSRTVHGGCTLNRHCSGQWAP
jgi:hypothetical protein